MCYWSFLAPTIICKRHPVCFQWGSLQNRLWIQPVIFLVRVVFLMYPLWFIFSFFVREAGPVSYFGPIRVSSAFVRTSTQIHPRWGVLRTSMQKMCEVRLFCSCCLCICVCSCFWLVIWVCLPALAQAFLIVVFW